MGSSQFWLPKMNSYFKSGQKWTKNNYLALSVCDTLCSSFKIAGWVSRIIWMVANTNLTLFNIKSVKTALTLIASYSFRKWNLLKLEITKNVIENIIRFKVFLLYLDIVSSICCNKGCQNSFYVSNGVVFAFFPLSLF